MLCGSRRVVVAVGVQAADEEDYWDRGSGRGGGREADVDGDGGSEI